MFALQLLLAAGSLPLISGAPVSPFTVLKTRATHSLEGRSTAYAMNFGGTGAVSDGWPDLLDWIPSFDQMFENNVPVLKSSCELLWDVPNNSDDEISEIKKSIQSVSKENNIDPRFTLAIVIQESNGCVRAPTTVYSHSNPGLMQSHQGTGSCNNGAVLTPCPADQILQMITDGVAGTAAGDGLKGCLDQAGGEGVTKYYKAARIYNSGSIDSSQNLGQGVATHCYVSDVTNRLLGWATGPSSCSPDLIGTLTGSPFVSSGGSSGGGDNSNTDPVDTDPVDTDTVDTDPVDTDTVDTDPTPVVDNPAPVDPTPTPPTPTPTVATAPKPNALVFAAEPDTTTSTTVPTPTATPAAVSPPVIHEPAAPGSILTPGSDCATDGEWNCITETTFQRCGSGRWTVVQQVAEGTTCAVGKSAAIQISNALANSKRAVGHDHFAQAHVVQHARHASSW